MAAQLWVLLVISIGLLINPADTSLMKQLISTGIEDITLSENIVKDKDGIITPSKLLASGDLSFAYSNELTEEEDLSGTVSFNEEGIELLEGQTVKLDSFLNARYHGDISSRRSDLTITVMRKEYAISHADELLEIEFSDEFNVLPIAKVYKQKLKVINNYNKTLDVQVGYSTQDYGIAIDPFKVPIQQINFLAEPGMNEIEIEIPTTDNLLEVQLNAQARLVYTYNGIRGSISPIPFNSVSRVYDLQPNIQEPAVETPKAPRKTRFFAGVQFGGSPSVIPGSPIPLGPQVNADLTFSERVSLWFNNLINSIKGVFA